MDSGILELECWVHGEDTGRIFPVEISSTKTVAALKEAIKNKNPVGFWDVDPRNLDLYPFRLPDHDENLEDALNQWQSNGNSRLNSRLKLSLCFPKSDEGKWLIIVNAPSSWNLGETIPLNCLVLGENSRNVFTVEIASTKNVALLKNLIKSSKQITFRDVDADALVLWEAPKSLLCNDDALKATIKGLHLEAKDALFPASRLSQIFPEPPNPDYLHIVVEPPACELSLMLPS
ncbi:hypothetical protein BU15DRAFT_56597 [Melanogaster broomeanus]|nr:hypothetical protein BU15DRAFT_56597 [Melanogaster broomeanus]